MSAHPRTDTTASHLRAGEAANTWPTPQSRAPLDGKIKEEEMTRHPRAAQHPLALGRTEKPRETHCLCPARHNARVVTCHTQAYTQARSRSFHGNMDVEYDNKRKKKQRTCTGGGEGCAVAYSGERGGRRETLRNSKKPAHAHAERNRKEERGGHTRRSDDGSTTGSDPVHVYTHAHAYINAHAMQALTGPSSQRCGFTLFNHVS